MRLRPSAPRAALQLPLPPLPLQLLLPLLAAAAAAAGAEQTEIDAAADAVAPEEARDEEAHGVLLLQTGLQHQRLRIDVMPASGGGGGAAAAPTLVVGDAPARRAAGEATATAAARKPQGVSQAFVQLFEWSWDDVAQECEEWLGPKGFAAALVSPPNEHIAGNGWFTRYQPVSYNLTSRSGNETQFVSMLQRCKAAGVGIYADAVFNHCAAGGGVGVGGSAFGYRTYPLFTPWDFHHSPNSDGTNCGVDNYKDKYNVQYCDLLGMPDLCTGCDKVQETVAAYINRMAELGIAGFRVDAAKHMDAGELQRLLSRVDSSLYRFQEVAASPGEAVQAPMYFGNGAVTEFGFAADLDPKFTAKGLLRDDLAKFGEAWGLAPSSDAVVFLDNHDTQRSGAAPLTFKSGELYNLVSMFMLAYPYGYPMVMSSYDFDSTEQGPPSESVHGPGGQVRCGKGQPWVCEHRRPAIANMVAWRRAAGDAPVRSFVAAGETLAFCRGEAACIAINLMESKPWEVKLSLSLPQGDYCDVARSSDAEDCPRVRVDASGGCSLSLPPRSAVALHVNARAAAPAPTAAAAAAPSEDEDLEDSLPVKW